MPKSAKRIVKKSRTRNLTTECLVCGQRVIPSAAGICPACHKPVNAVHTEVRSRPSPVSALLFSPRQIFFLSMITGYPTGLVLSSINWIRMGMTGTAVLHWLAGVILLTLWSFGGNVIGSVLDIAFCVYLSQQMRQNIKQFKLDGNEIRPVSWKRALAYSLATLGILFGVLVLLILLLLNAR
jgi:hypothetical protein